MTKIEWKIACRLSSVTFLPGSFDKKFAKQLANWKDRELTEKGRAFMITLLHKYRRQIEDYNTICNELATGSPSI